MRGWNTAKPRVRKPFHNKTLPQHPASGMCVASERLQFVAEILSLPVDEERQRAGMK